jgi:hypothetical protein
MDRIEAIFYFEAFLTVMAHGSFGKLLRHNGKFIGLAREVDQIR